jgi:hypothetical protein
MYQCKSAYIPCIVQKKIHIPWPLFILSINSLALLATMFSGFWAVCQVQAVTHPGSSSSILFTHTLHVMGTAVSAADVAHHVPRV